MRSRVHLRAHKNPMAVAMRERREALSVHGLKECSTCKAAKPFQEFSKSRAEVDGYANACKECARARNAEWRRANPNGYRRWAELNRERVRRQQASWRALNREYLSKAYKEWAAANPGKVNANIMRRYASKRHATPAWADRGRISQLYSEASKLTRETGIRHDVDHIVPLQSPIVCGLHWHGNLQILTRAENLKKSNRMAA